MTVAAANRKEWRMSWPARAPSSQGGASSRDDARWAALCARRDDSADRFVYAVKTTGIYCLPGCASRLPKRQNVSFHDSAAGAAAAGYRACLRCRPDDPGRRGASEAILQACRMIEASATPPSLAELAAQAGLSPFHFQRRFKAVVGLTPAAYARARRAERVRAALVEGADVTAAIFEAGFNSSGRFYETSPARLGMTPKVFGNGGRDETIRYAVGDCWLGKVLAAATQRGLCAISLGDDADRLVADLRMRFAKADIAPAGADFTDTFSQVLAMLERPDEKHALPLDVRGAAFQERVWQALTRIPPGSTASYKDIARAIGAPKAARAVARACAGNVLAVAVPCHRVVRADGALSGYRWGTERKHAILAREKQAKR
jgi:AraC family transcriptional regulator of adaptative response/methylated-DNA-[protein]-cysteine methyltransferase